MTDLGWIFAALSALACSAWFFAEVRITKLEGRVEQLHEDYDYVCEENDIHKRLLQEAISALPETPRGRELGDAIRYQAWSDRQQRRLLRHLSLVDRTPSA